MTQCLILWCFILGPPAKTFPGRTTVQLDTSTRSFGFLYAAVEDEKGYVVADSKNYCLHAYSPEGRYVWSTGTEGEGPGEFGLPVALCIQGPELFVLDRVRSKIQVFVRATGQYKRAFNTVDGRVLRSYGETLFLGTTKSETNASLYAYNLEGSKLFHASPIPKITMANGLMLSGVSLDMDGFGNVYLIHQMEYTINKIDNKGKAIKSMSIQSPGYVAPPSDPVKNKFSRKALTQWIESFSSILSMVVLDQSKRIIVCYSRPGLEEPMSDVLSLNGVMVTAGVPDLGRLINKDHLDRPFYLDPNEDGVFISTYQLK